MFSQVSTRHFAPGKEEDSSIVLQRAGEKRGQMRRSRSVSRRVIAHPLTTTMARTHAHTSPLSSPSVLLVATETRRPGNAASEGDSPTPCKKRWLQPEWGVRARTQPAGTDRSLADSHFLDRFSQSKGIFTRVKKAAKCM